VFNALVRGEPLNSGLRNFDTLHRRVWRTETRRDGRMDRQYDHATVHVVLLQLSCCACVPTSRQCTALKTRELNCRFWKRETGKFGSVGLYSHVVDV